VPSSPDTPNRPAVRLSDCPTQGRLLAIDPGARRIGLAVSDELQTIAQPFGTVSRRAGKRFPLRHILAAANEQHVVGVVVGLPLESEGGEGAPAMDARALAADIGRLSGLPVELLDERMTTARVLQAVREMGGTTRRRKKDIDAMAAALILQRYLDARRGSAS
jgi:putative Holliday junction resolvase